LVTAVTPVAPDTVIGPTACKVTADTASVPPLSLVTVLTSVRVGSLVLVKLQVKSAPAFTLAEGIVSVLPLKVPIEPVFPVITLFASVHVAAVIAKPVTGVSVNVMSVFNVETLIAVGPTGAAVLAVVVVMLDGVLTKFVCEIANGPPTPPVVVFCTFTVGVFVLVIVQAMFEPAVVAAASSVMLPVAKFGVAVPVDPRPEQLAAVMV
jgi:hypothetical protein